MRRLTNGGESCPVLFFEELYLKQFGWILAILGLLGCIWPCSCGRRNCYR